MFIIICVRCGKVQDYKAGVNVDEIDLFAAGRGIFCGCGTMVLEGDDNVLMENYEDWDARDAWGSPVH